MSSRSVSLHRTNGCHVPAASRLPPPSPRQRVCAAAGGSLLLLAIDRRQARIYLVRSRGGVPEQIVPYDPFGYRRSSFLVWNNGGAAVPVVGKKFQDAIVTTLRGSEPVLMFASGGAAANAVMERLIDCFSERHPQLHGRLIGSMVIDEPEDEAFDTDVLLPKIREFCAMFAPECPTTTN